MGAGGVTAFARRATLYIIRLPLKNVPSTHFLQVLTEAEKI